jgi:hypothetical protein
VNELYNETIERNGKTYHYDPDRDIYYCRYEPMSTFDKYAWIVMIVLLLMICIGLDYFK